MSTQGDRLKKIRKFLNLSQEEFGKKIGLTRGAIAAVEADGNKFSQEVLYKLIEIFNINVNYLLAGKGEPFILSDNNNINAEFLNEIKNILCQYEIKRIVQ